MINTTSFLRNTNYIKLIINIENKPCTVKTYFKYLTTTIILNYYV